MTLQNGCDESFSDESIGCLNEVPTNYSLVKRGQDGKSIKSSQEQLTTKDGTIMNNVETAIAAYVEDEPAKPRTRWKQFPVDALPSPLDGWVQKSADVIGCDPSLIAMPLLTAAGCAVGTKRKVYVNPEWACFPNVWTIVCGVSGSKKSCGVERVRTLLTRKEQEYSNAFDGEMKSFRPIEVSHKRAVTQFSNGKSKVWPGDLVYPIRRRCMIQDVTFEGACVLLADNPQGLCLIEGELDSFFQSLNGRYGKASDVPRWLDLRNGTPLTVDRKGDRREGGKPIHVPHALIGITGTIQPKILRRCFDEEALASGLAARFLVANPPPPRFKDLQANIPSNPFDDDTFAIFNTLWDMAVPPSPITMPLSQLAWGEFRRWRASHESSRVEFGISRDSPLGAAWAKLEETPIRLAGIIQLTLWAANQTHADPDSVDGEAMERAIRLTDWFINEARRFYAMTAEDYQLDDVLNWAREREPCKATVRELSRSGICRHGDDPAGLAESLLGKLVKLGLGEWVGIDHVGAGRKSRWFNPTGE